ncbi:MAG TPA: transcriptional regulator [Planctomycetaceae bacterium]|nr:transcriptional regulator [Planctomycetaceae bacterium]HBC61621.1 transcriptional regulator [Planctomycetaceae bacterium]
MSGRQCGFGGSSMAAIDTRDREILEYLHQSEGVDVQSLCDLLGVTRTAVRQRISRLEAAGLIVSELQGQSRGRPRNVYRVTAEGLHALGENYRQLAVVLWEAITGFEDEAVRMRLLGRVRDVLAERFRRQLGNCENLDDRLDLLASEMKSSGFNVESDHQGGLRILRETSCPFPMLAEVDDAICQVERQVLEQVLGAPVEVRSRCRDGHGCCEFQVLNVPVG